MRFRVRRAGFPVGLTAAQAISWALVGRAVAAGRPIAMLHLVFATLGLLCWAWTALERVPEGSDDAC